MIRIAPSLLAADFGNLARDIASADRGGADLMHCDVMDGSFVPAISYGHDITAAVGRNTDVPLDVHLMVVDPSTQVDLFAPIKPAVITFHLEAVDDPHPLIRKINNLGVRAGVSVKPGTPVEPLLELLPDLGLVLVMTVEPGAGGQSFMEGMVPKVSTVAAAIEAGGHDVMLQVDGGISAATIATAARAGADTFVAGTAVFRHPDGVFSAISELRHLASST
ncbi:MAG: ribulose-phosphate 3-epimerase [Chloroflexota bacterium]|nr:ribulose-phosphate 3-epimerase [Chloroflexota bacterium]